jgi:hypothetical protein
MSVVQHLDCLSLYVASKPEFLNENHLTPYLLREINGNKICLAIECRTVGSGTVLVCWFVGWFVSEGRHCLF